MKEFSLSKHEFNILVDRVAAHQQVQETSSRTIKRAFLEIQRLVHSKLKTSLEFSAKEKDRTNQILSLFASSGAGKSWMVNDLLMRNPAIQNVIVPHIYLFSSVGSDDPSYKPIKEFYGVERFFWMNPRDLDEDMLNIHSYKEKSVLIFDDVWKSYSGADLKLSQ